MAAKQEADAGERLDVPGAAGELLAQAGVQTAQAERPSDQAGAEGGVAASDAAVKSARPRKPHGTRTPPKERTGGISRWRHRPGLRKHPRVPLTTMKQTTARTTPRCLGMTV